MLGVEVVGGLVQQEDVRLLQKQAAEGHATAFAAGKLADRLVFGRAAQGVHRPLQLGVEVPGVGGVDDVLQLGLAGKEFVHLVGILVVFGQGELLVDFLVLGQGIHHGLHALHHHFLHGLVGVQHGFLGQVAHGVARREDHFALVGLVQPGNDFEQGGLTRTVQTDDADFRPVEEGQVDVLQYLLVVLLNRLVQPYHREDDFLVINCCHIACRNLYDYRS